MNTMKPESRLEKLLVERVTDANLRWQLFEPDERVLIAVSGGKDSMALPELLRLFPISFDLVHVGTDVEPEFMDYCAKVGRFHHVDEDILSQLPGRKNPCYECSKLRRRRILEVAERHGIRTIVLGHHKNDVTETLLLNMIFSREISTMTPKQELFDGAYRIIRPFFTVPENLIESYARERNFPVVKEKCPHSGRTKREMIRELVRNLQHEQKSIDVVDNIYSSMKHIKHDFLPDFSGSDS